MRPPKGVKVEGLKDGLVNKRQTEEIGLEGATHAVNVDFTDLLKWRRRRGVSLRVSDPGHSLWSTPDHSRGFYVSTQDGMLRQVLPDLSTMDILGVPDLRMAFANIGLGEQSYVAFSNGQTIGTIDQSGQVTVWDRTGRYDRSVIFLDVSEDEEHFDTLPPGILLAFFGGRLWCYSKLEGGIFYSENWRPHLCNRRDNFLRLPDVTMIAAVDDGFYVSTSERVLYKSSLDPTDASPLIQVSDAPAIFGSAIETDGAVIGSSGFDGKVVIWESAKGKMIGARGGRVYAATKKRFANPVGERCAALMIENRGILKHLGIMENPSGNDNAFQAHDYATAEIRRNGIVIT